MTQKPIEVSLEWQGAERFRGASGTAPILLDGGDPAALSPMQAVASGLAGCMAIDVAMILEKGRQDLRSLEVRLIAERAEEPPRRFVSCRLHFRLAGVIEASKVERAIALSRETYCSVWHSLRRDIELETSFEIDTPE